VAFFAANPRQVSALALARFMPCPDSVNFARAALVDPLAEFAQRYARMHHYYIYYRIDERDERELETLVRSMQARLKCQTGVEGRLLKKREEPTLWMEIYEGIENGPGFEAALERAVSRFEVDMFLAPGSTRKLECFIA
jgi:hypothetical protein